MKRLLLILSVACTLAGEAAATNGEEGHLRRRPLLSVETTAGTSFSHGKLSASDYSIRVITGYTFCPQFSVGVAAGGGCSLDDGTNFVPVSLHLRSELLDRKVSPFVSLDLGCAFQIHHAGCSEENILVNDDIFRDRLGGKSLDDYLAGLPGDIPREDALNDLKSFSNGSCRYLSEVHSSALQSSREGAFCELTLGAALGLRDGGRLHFGLCGALAEHAENLWMRTRDNRFCRWSLHENLPSGRRAFAEGRDGSFKERLRMEIRFKVGFSF